MACCCHSQLGPSIFHRSVFYREGARYRGSWINQVERWFALLSARAIKRNSHHTVLALESAIKRFIEAHNNNPKPFRWTKTVDEILNNLPRFAAETVAIQGAELRKKSLTQAPRMV